MDAGTLIDTSSTSSDTLKWVWKNLVPKSGQASSVQGELLRVIEQLRWEAQGNGNINWDSGFERYISFLRSTLLTENHLSHGQKDSLTSDLDRLENFIFPDQLSDDHLLDDQLPYIDDDLYDRVGEHIAEFCRQQPRVISRETDPNQHR